MNEFRAAALVMVSCSAACSNDPSSAADGQRPAVSDACVIARGDGFVIDRGEAEALRHRFAPPPDIEQASRLALDVWLAEWIATGAIEHVPLRLRLQHHNKFATLPLQERLAALADAREALAVTLGPCWPRRSSHPGHVRSR